MNPLYNVNTSDIANRGLQAMGQASQTAASFDKERTTLGAPKKTVGGGVGAAAGGASLGSAMATGLKLGGSSGGWYGAAAGAVVGGLAYYLS